MYAPIKSYFSYCRVNRYKFIALGVYFQLRLFFPLFAFLLAFRNFFSRLIDNSILSIYSLLQLNSSSSIRKRINCGLHLNEPLFHIQYGVSVLITELEIPTLCARKGAPLDELIPSLEHPCLEKSTIIFSSSSSPPPLFFN
jgi:hypothetical protein